MLFFDLLFNVGVVHDGVEFFVEFVHVYESGEGLFVVVDVSLYGVNVVHLGDVCMYL